VYTIVLVALAVVETKGQSDWRWVNRSPVSIRR